MKFKRRTRQSQFAANVVSAPRWVIGTRVFKAIILILILTMITPATGNVSGAPAQQASSLTFIADADARVQESNPSTNYGTSSYLVVDGVNNPDIESFIRFAVNGVTGSIQNAQLRVYVTTNSSANGPAAYGANNSWTETGITWNNRPSRIGGALDNKGSTSRNSWVEYNVTAALTGNGTYTFVLAADSSDAIRFSSREGSRAPELVVTLNSGGSTATATQLSASTKTQTAVAPPSQTATRTRTPTAGATVTQPSGSTNTPTRTQTPAATSTRTSTPAATFTNSPAPVSQVLTLHPTADSYVDSGSPSTNYGTQTQLRGDGSPVVRSYLRFDVQGFSGAVTRATLRIYANSASTTGYEIRNVINNTWGETTITYGNAPAVGTVLDTSGGFNSGVWTTVDVTPYITGTGTYSLALTVPGSTAISFASREVGNNAPQLLVEIQGGVAATRTATAGVNTATATRTPTNAPQGTTTPSRTPTTSSGSVVLVGAGDIASCSRSQDEQTAQLLDNIPGTVFTTGDNAYVDGTYTEYINCYDPNWGRHKSRTKPSPGNHDYLTSGAAGYFQYFNNIPSYYAYDLGAWRIYSLNSEISVSATSAQATWLQNDLAANPRQCVMAYWHKARWSSGSNHGDNTSIQPLWQILYDAGAELVVAGHEHHYERFAEMNASGVSVSQGLREIVAGTGGATLYPFGSPKSASQVRNNTAYGVVKLTLRSNSYDWQFVPVSGSTFTDSGSTNCH
jgi:acid phosphatase type 7